MGQFGTDNGPVRIGGGKRICYNGKPDTNRQGGKHGFLCGQGYEAPEYLLAKGIR